MANVLYGHKNTHKITLENIIQHSLSVKIGIKKSLFVVDMPKGSYSTIKLAEKNAKYLFKKIGCDAIKIESNNKKSKNHRNIDQTKYPCNGPHWIYASI